MPVLQRIGHHVQRGSSRDFAQKGEEVIQSGSGLSPLTP
jgi:hypothetical protein